MHNFPRILYVPNLAAFAEEVKPDHIVRLLVTDDHNLRTGIVTSVLTVQGDSYLEQNLVCLRYSVTSRGEAPDTRVGQMLIVASIVRDYLSALGYTVRDGRYAQPLDYSTMDGVLECISWRRQKDGGWRVKPSESYRRVVGVSL